MGQRDQPPTGDNPKRSAKPAAAGGQSDAEERALADALAPPSALEQLAEWRAKVTARLSKSPKSPRGRAPKARPKKG